MEHKVYLFELDDVLYPKREYVLQVYYLFSNFVEYTVGKPIAKDILNSMKNYYEKKGEDGNIEQVIADFELEESIKENFERLYANAQLPLKLELYPSSILYIGDLISQGKEIGLLTKGNPVEQLNKIRQMNWKGLDRYMKVYFWDELVFRELKPYFYLAEEYGVKPDEIDHMTIKPQL